MTQFFIIAYLMEQILFELLGVGAIPTFVVFVVINIVYVLHQGRLFLSINKAHLTVFFLLALQEIIFPLFSPEGCGISNKHIASVLFLVSLVLSIKLAHREPFVFSDRSSKFVLYCIVGAFLISQLGFDLMGMVKEVSRKTGFFSEPSHLAIYVMPFIFYRFFHNIRDRLSWVVTFMIFTIAPSSTFIISFIFLLYVRFILANKSLITSALLLLISSACVIAISSLDGLEMMSAARSVSFIDRFVGVIDSNPDGISNISSAVWLNGWSQASEHFKETYGVGVGLNQMGCGAMATAGYLSHLLMFGGDIALNGEDGSFLFSKFVSEFGIVGFLLCSYVTILCIFALRSYARMRLLGSLVPFDIYDSAVSKAAGAALLLICLYIRSLTLFSVPVVLCLYLLFHNNSRIRSNTQITKESSMV